MANRLGEFATGRPGDANGTYEKVVRRTSYLLVYAATDETIVTLRVIHMARDRPEE